MNFRRTTHLILTALPRAIHRHGFGVQSPWAYELVRDVLYEPLPYYAYQEQHLTTPLQQQLFRIRNHYRHQPLIVINEKGQAKNALTIYELEKNLAAADFGLEEDYGLFPISLMALTLATGRTHQIRIHLAQSGLPIIGDDKYGDFKANKGAKKTLGIKRLCLCAFRLTLPLLGKEKIFEISPDFFSQN